MRSLAALLLSGISTFALAGEIAWKAPTEVASGQGLRGPWRQNESRYDYVDDPAVAIGEDGVAALAWVDQGRKDVFFLRQGEHEPVNVSRSPASFSWLPRIALAPGNARRIFVLWQEIIFSGGSHGGEILYARSEDAGASFSPPVNLSRSAAGDGKGRITRAIWHNGSLDIAAGADGSVYAAWTEYEGALWVAASRDGGRSFAPPLKIEEPAPARAPALAVAPDGVVYLAWTIGDDGGADIRVAKSRDRGSSFATPTVAEASGSYSDAPKLAVDPAGTLHLVYAESAGGPFDRYRILYTRSTDGGQTFRPARPLAPVNAAFPSMSVDASGDIYVAWERYDDHRSRPRGLGFTVSRDAGRTFSAPAFVPGSADPAGRRNASLQGLLMRKLAAAGDGEVALVNSSLRDDEASRVWLIRGQRQKW